MTSSCSFSNECLSKQCENYTICSLLNTERHITMIENRIGDLFASINSILDFSKKSGQDLLSIKETVVTKEYIDGKIKLILNELNLFKQTFLEREMEIINSFKKLEELTKAVERLEERVSLNEQGRTNV